MKYWLDTEFNDTGSTIDLISIALVAEDGREFYGVNSDMDVERIRKDEWLMQHVVPHLPLVGKAAMSTPTVGPGSWSFTLDRFSIHVKPKWVIRNEVLAFLREGAGAPELWAWYAAYDHVALCQLFGRMVDLPVDVPMWTNDIRQLQRHLGDPMLDIDQAPEGEHNALEDARHAKKRWEALDAYEAERGVSR